jgi:hypothetical protein
VQVANCSRNSFSEVILPFSFARLAIPFSLFAR